MRLTILIVAVFITVLWSCNNEPKKKVVIPNPETDSITETVVANPFFRKDGQLIFTEAKTFKEIVKIDIEVADAENEIIKGLMDRDSIPANAGMLFMMGIEEPQSFWMKNTRISLDIIYVSADNIIVNICPNTEPYSLKNVNSDYPALYVVEVNAGFAKKHGIKAGDRIVF